MERVYIDRGLPDKPTVFVKFTSQLSALRVSKISNEDRTKVLMKSRPSMRSSRESSMETQSQRDSTILTNSRQVFIRNDSCGRIASLHETGGGMISHYIRFFGFLGSKLK